MVLRIECSNYRPIGDDIYKKMIKSGGKVDRKVTCIHRFLINGECPQGHENICLNKDLRPAEVKEIRSTNWR